MRDRFRAAGLDTPELDARLLAQLAFGIDAMTLVRREREVAPAEAVERLEGFVARRLAGEPVSRIVGKREFWGLDFVLGPETLDPRPATEKLVEEAVGFLEGRAGRRFVDLGTGSGAIAIAIVASVAGAEAIGTDLSPSALEIARLNAVANGVSARIDFRRGSWWEAVPENAVFDLIVSNPPYIAHEAIDGLAPEVRLFDPMAALDGGRDGLEAYRAIVAQAVRHLRPDGLMLFEIGYNQGEAVQRMVLRAGFARVEVIKDLEGLDRVVAASHS